jgi:hypothetical protein
MHVQSDIFLCKTSDSKNIYCNVLISVNVHAHYVIIFSSIEIFLFTEYSHRPKKYETLSQLLIAKIFAIISGIFIISTIEKIKFYRKA